MNGGGLTNTVRVCSLSGTPGAATSDTIFIIAGCGGLTTGGAHDGGGVVLTGKGLGSGGTCWGPVSGLETGAGLGFGSWGPISGGLETGGTGLGVSCGGLTPNVAGERPGGAGLSIDGAGPETGGSILAFKG